MRNSDIKVQIDRWPITEKYKSTHVVTIVAVAAFDEYPNAEELARMAKDAAAIVKKLKD